MLFGEWSEAEWSKFDNYAIDNLQLYLKNGLMVCGFRNLKVRKFMLETCSDFWEWSDSDDNPYRAREMLSRYGDVQQLHRAVSRRTVW